MEFADHVGIRSSLQSTKCILNVHQKFHKYLESTTIPASLLHAALILFVNFDLHFNDQESIILSFDLLCNVVLTLLDIYHYILLQHQNLLHYLFMLFIQLKQLVNDA